MTTSLNLSLCEVKDVLGAGGRSNYAVASMKADDWVRNCLCNEWSDKISIDSCGIRILCWFVFLSFSQVTMFLWKSPVLNTFVHS